MKQLINKVYFDIDKKTRVRTVRWLLILFELSGFKVIVPLCFNRLILLLVKIRKWHSNLEFRYFNKKKYSIVCTTKDIKKTKITFDKKVIQLVFDYSPKLELKDQDFTMPFLMHPQTYVQYKEHEKLTQYRQSKRKIRLLFAGNWDEGYHNETITQVCKKRSRYEIMQHIISNKLAKIVTCEAELNNIIYSDYLNEFVLIDTKKMRIDQGKWLKTLSCADFFLCPPGVHYPLSCNAVEAIAVGTIPLINYSEWFFPALVQGKDSMVFDSLQELDKQIGNIKRMSDEEITLFRNNVIDYYDKHLSPQVFLHKLLNSSYDKVRLHLLEEDVEYITKALK